MNAREVSLDDLVRASARASSATGSVVYLSLGEVQPLRQLLKAVAIAGANDAAIAVAEYVAGSEAAFVERMNRRARELGMIGTVFANSHGLPPGPGEREAVTTARDMAVAARGFDLRPSRGAGVDQSAGRALPAEPAVQPVQHQ